MHSPLRVISNVVLHLKYVPKSCMLLFVSYNVNIIVALLVGDLPASACEP